MGTVTLPFECGPVPNVALCFLSYSMQVQSFIYELKFDCQSDKAAHDRVDVINLEGSGIYRATGATAYIKVNLTTNIARNVQSCLLAKSNFHVHFRIEQ